MALPALLPMIMSAASSMASKDGDKGGGAGGGGGMGSMIKQPHAELQNITNSIGNIFSATGAAKAGQSFTPAAPAAKDAAQSQPAAAIPSVQSPGVSNGPSSTSIKVEADKGLDTGAFKLSDERQKEGVTSSADSRYTEMRARAKSLRGSRG
jgi:hypothetical protein